MKKLIAIVTLTIVIFAAAIASAQDVMLDVTVKSVIEKNDKNGNPYKRVIFLEAAELNGIQYNKSAVLMVFADQLEQVSALTVGQDLRCIAAVSDYKGRTSYTLQAVID